MNVEESSAAATRTVTPSRPGGSRTRSVAWALALGVVAIMLLSAAPMPAYSFGSAGAPTARLSGAPLGFGSPGAAPSAHPGALALPNGTCGIAKWCPAVTGNITAYSTTTAGLLSTVSGGIPCAVPLTSGVCTTAAGANGKSAVSPYLNATNDVALNYTSKGVLAMAYTNYTTLPPTGAATCTPARPAATSEISFTTSPNRGTTWAKPILLGTPDCASAANYPSAYDPALTSLLNGTVVLAYVQYEAKAPTIPPFINTSAVPLSRLVVTELYPGATGWSVPHVVNVSNPSKSLTVAFSPARPSLGANGKTIYLTWMNLGTPVPVAVISHVAMVVSTTGGKSWSPTIQLSSGSQYAGNPNVLVQPGTGELYVAYDTAITYCGYQVGCSAVNSKGTPYTGSVVVASSQYNGTSFSTVTVASGIRMNQTFGPFYNPAPLLAWGTGYSYLTLAFVGGVSTPTYRNGAVVNGASVTPDLYLYTSSNGGTSFVSHVSQSENAIVQPARLWGGLSNSTQLLDIAMVPEYNTTVSLEATVFNGSACVSGYCGAETEVALNVSANGTVWSSPWVVSGAISTNGTAGGWQDYLTGEYGASIELGSPANVLYAWDVGSCPSWSSLKAGSLGQCGTFSGTGGTPVWTLYGTSQVALSTRYTGATVAETFSPNLSIPANATWGLEFMGAFFASNGSANITLKEIPSGLPMLFNGTGPGVWHVWSEYVGGATTPTSPYTFSSSNSPLVTLSFTEEVPIILHLLPLLLAGHNCKASYAGYCPLFSTPPGPSMSAINPYNCLYTTCSSPPSGSTTNIAADLTCVAYYYVYTYNDPYYEWDQDIDYEGVGCANAYVAHTVGGTPVFNITYNQKVFVPVGKNYTLSPETWSVANTLCGLGYSASNYPPGYSSWTYYFQFLECYEDFFVELTPLAWIGNGTGSVTSSSLSITVDPTTAVNESIDWNITGYCSGSYDEYYFEYFSGTIYSNVYNATPCYAGNPYAGSSSSSGVPVPLSATEKGLPAGTEWGLQASSPGASTVTKTSTKDALTMSLLSGTTYDLNVLTIPVGKTGQYWIGTTNATVTMPDFYGIVVNFTIGSLSGRSFTATIVENGLPSTSGWILDVTNGTAAPTNYTELPGEGTTVPIEMPVGGGDSYAFNGSSVTTSAGIQYYAALVNVSVVSINGTSEQLPPWQASAVAAGAMLVNITYEPAYYVTVQATSGGTTLSGSQFVKHGQTVNLTAKANAGYLFTGWVGSGNGSVSSASLTIKVKPSNPVTEFAVFRPIPAPTWILNVTASGLAFGQPYSLTIDGVTYSGVGTFAIGNITSGDHTFSAPIAYSATTPPDIQYTATSISTSFGSANSGPVLVGANGTVAVTFSTSYLLALASTPGGSITGASNGAWLMPGATVTLTALPANGYEFVGWNGTGSGSFTGTSTTAPVTANGPITELAEFELIPPPPIAKYSLTISESGLPSGISWNATVGVVGGNGASSASGSQIVIGGLVADQYTLTVPTVYGASGVRYVPNQASASGAYTSPETVSTANLNAAVTFTIQYLVTVLIAGNGTVSPGTEWVTAGSSASLVATPSSVPTNGVSWKFASWNGSSASENVTATTLSFTVSGPTTVTATFVPAYHAKTTTSQFLNAPIGFALLAVLLVVGFALAFLMTRRRKPPASSSAGMGAGSGAEMGGAAAAAPMEPNGSPPGDEAEWAEPDVPEGPA
jgi:hypothetical protein